MKEKIRVSDYIAKFLESRGVTKIFMVTESFPYSADVKTTASQSLKK